MLKITIVQIKNSTNVEGNFKTILKYLTELETQKVDLILFPECSLSGFSAQLKNCTEAELAPYFKLVEEWSAKHQKSVVLPSAIVEDNGIMNSGYYFNQGSRQRFYKHGLTESELKFFSTPKFPTPKILTCKDYKFALLICIEAEHPPWTYFAPTTADFILWPGYWGWEKEDAWGPRKTTKDEENLIYKNQQEWKLPIIQANFAYNDSSDHRSTGPKGLSVVVDKENKCVMRGVLGEEGWGLVEVDGLGVGK